MNNLGDSASDEEELKTLPMDYRTLLAITRPLVLTPPTSLSLRASIFEDKVVSLGARDRWVEFALRKGEIICSDSPISNSQDEEGLATTPALPQRGSDLRIRIHLGMS
jgi:hypothetical protein